MIAIILPSVSLAVPCTVNSATARHRLPVAQEIGPVGVATVAARMGLTKGSRRPADEIFEETFAAATGLVVAGFFCTILGSPVLRAKGLLTPAFFPVGLVAVLLVVALFCTGACFGTGFTVSTGTGCFFWPLAG